MPTTKPVSAARCHVSGAHCSRKSALRQSRAPGVREIRANRPMNGGFSALIAGFSEELANDVRGDDGFSEQSAVHH